MEKIAIADTPRRRNFLEGKSVKETQELEKLINKDKIAICGYTFTKISKSIKNQESFEKLLKGFLALPYMEIEKEDWKKASRIIFTNKKLTLGKAPVKVLGQR